VADDAAFAAFDLAPLRQMEITTRQSIRLLSVCSGHPSLQEAKALTLVYHKHPVGTIEP
jgi:hypothetical protein